MRGTGTVITADWTGARLRLRWEYEINANEEAIRLDPSIPSLAVGNPLPTAVDGGGDGLWVGYNSGTYKLRLGKASGVGLALDGDGAGIEEAANVPTITLDSAGNSRFDGPMTLGPLGGIWQGTGTFAAPVNGLKLWNNGGGAALWAFDANGANTARFDRGGFTLKNLTYWKPENTIKWARDDNSIIGLITSAESGPVGERFIEMGLDAKYGEWYATKVGIRIGIFGGDPEDSYIDLVSKYVAATEIQVGTMSVLGPAKIGGGLALGSAAFTPPAAGRILMKQSTGATTVPAGAALLYVENQVNGRQALYIRFDDGTFVKIAESNS
jgi:hypothetical protein